MLPFLLHFSVVLAGAAIFSLFLVVIPYVRRGIRRISHSEEYLIPEDYIFLSDVKIVTFMSANRGTSRSYSLMFKIPSTLANLTTRLTVNQSVNVISGERSVKFQLRLSNGLMSSVHGHHFRSDSAR
jgi:hypothetical protein